jgi:dihydroflavonol-4-reductase
MRLLITGATGFLGAEVVRQALAEGHTVRVLRRRTSSLARLEGLAVEHALGDVTDAPNVRAALEGVEACIHCAGDTSYYVRDAARMRAVNVDGVRHVVAGARDAGVRRLVVTSSVAAVGFDRGGQPVDETCGWNWPSAMPYMETKWEGEKLALAASGGGMEVVVINPATLLGPGGMNVSEEQYLRDILEQRLPGIPTGGATAGDVADAAAAHLAALTRGRSGQRYIVGGHHVTHRRFVEDFARAFGVPAPRATLPGWLLAVLGAGLLMGERLGMRPSQASTPIRLGRYGIYHASALAEAELGFRARPWEEIVARTAADFLARHRPGAASGQ